MSLETYNDLQGAIGEWLARGDEPTLVSRIPDFITLAEAYMLRELTSLDTERSITITATDGVYDLPADYDTFRSLTGVFASRKYSLSYRTPSEFAREVPVSGPAELYKIEGRQMILGPTPEDTTEFTFGYYAKFQPLSDNNQTNWLLTTFPDAYLFGSLAEASAFDRNDVAEAKWKGRFNESVEQVRSYLDDQKLGGAPLQIRSD